ncbi:MAG TPA: hypothetical protein QF624_09455 [Dehalococcoidia bacterium]|jgi:hypothetical protein|nr:hypothetical protein [Dehalococcoidia bacterium]
MGCPAHIWVPVMASMAPFARVARDRLRMFAPRRQDAPTDVPEAPVMQRWAPIQPAAAPDPSDNA